MAFTPTKYSPDQLDVLRRTYAKVRDVPAGSTAHKKLAAMVNAMTPEAAQQVASANIRWLSDMARRRLDPAAPEAPSAGTHVRDNGRGFL